MKKIMKKTTSLFLAAAIALGSGTTAPVFASETFVGGTAPFMNTWLTSGPFDEPVIDHIYGLSGGGGDVEIPSPEFNQTEQIFGIGSANSIKRGSAEHRFTDGYTSTPWQSNVEKGNNQTTFKTTLEYPADVTSLQLYGYYENSETPETDPFSVKYQAKNSSGEVLAEGTVTNLTNEDNETAMRTVSFDHVLNDVTVIEFTMDTSEETNGHSCTGSYYGMREVYVYGLPPAAPDLSERGIEEIAIESAAANNQNGDNGADFVLDQDDESAWQSDTAPENSGAWETPKLTLTLPEEKIITAITLKGYEISGKAEFAINYELQDSEGKTLFAGTKYNVTGTADEQVIGLNYGVTGVKQIALSIDPTNGGTVTPDETAGYYGIRSVALQGMDLLQDTVDLKPDSTQVSSQTGGNEADKAFDNNMETMWRCDNRSGATWDSRPTMTINFNNAMRMDSLSFTFYEEFPEDGIGRHVSCMLYDSAGRLIYSGGVMANNGTESGYDFGIGAVDVKQIKLLINPSGITNGSDKLGFYEVKINGAEMKDSGGEALGDISPKLGEMLEDTAGDEKSEWRYFDDRVFNRNQDDYNDLMGFYDVKRGEDTLNRYVAAGVYVYSDRAQTVQWQFAGSGKYKLFCNDFLVGEQSNVPGDVKKSGTKYAISLKEGWNKLLVQIQHVNPNKQCNLLGFYSRLCDADGNLVEGLTYSVSGPNPSNGTLEVVTQGLDIDREAFEQRNADCTANEYPENILPYAYEKNPYVGLVSVSTAGYAGQASLFSFQAAGGKPGYRWELIDGELPGGLRLNEDGTVSGTVEAGAANNSTKDYAFTVKVTDADGVTAEKNFVMTAKPNPVQWFEEGRMSALSHCTGTIPNLYDPNYNYDQWAQTAKEMGLTMLSTESFQNSLYYWPSPNANLTPNDSNPQYKYETMYQDENGEWHIKDRVMEAKEAAERYGLRFGTYLSPQCPQSDIQGLVERYDPWYIFVDGNPQGGVNLDIAFSSARNYNDRVLFNTNPTREVSDQDITLMERPFWYSQPYTEGGNWENNIQPAGKYFVHEEWNDPYSTALDLWRVWAPGGDQMRDSWPDATKELIDAIGHGYVMNHDLSIAASRGLDNLNWGGQIRTSMDKDNVYMMIPVDSQQMSDMRTSMAQWLMNEGKPDLHESLFGTMPYYIEYTPKSGWHEPGTQQAFFYGEGPEWGYGLYRDQYVYLHMIENYIGEGRNKVGFTGQSTMENIGPFDYEVKNVTWLNEGKQLSFTQSEKDGKYYIEIDTTEVTADPIDTIIKIETADPTRNYSMTDMHVFSSQTEGSELKLRTECYLNDYTSVFAPATVTYSSADDSIATVDADGTIRAVNDGETEILVTASYDDGVNAEQVLTDTYPVIVKNGKVSANLPLTGIGMFTDDNAFWAEVFAGTSVPVDLKGYTEYGGTVDLVNAENITYHYAKVDGSTDNPTGKITVTEVSQDEVPFELKDGKLILDAEGGTDTYYCYWADVTVNGETYTSSRNYITLMPDHNVVENAKAEVSSGNADALTDGVINDATGGNLSKWSSDVEDENPSITFDLEEESVLTRINLFYNRTTAEANAITYTNAPEQVKIEYSTDGVTWTTGNTIDKQTGDTLPSVNSFDQVPTSEKTSYAWEAENIFYNYPIDQNHDTVKARYVRISFPGGGQNGSAVDLLEVRVFAQSAEEYSISIDDAMVNGSVTADKAQAKAGETVTLTVVPDAGYRLVDGSLKVTGASGEVALNGNQFVMPEENVTITAQFEPDQAVSYQATVENGSGSGEYEAGAEVTITADEAPEGKVFDKWVSDDVTFADAESESTTFVMPEKDVTVTATYREAANKSLLQKTYDYALTLDTEGVVESAVKLFEQAKANAKAVLDDPKATQEEVNTAWDELLEGIWGLGLTQGDKTMLEQLIAKAESMIPNQDKYVQDHWQELVDALEAAKKVMDDGDAMKEDVVAATDALMNAILAQRYKADKSILEDLINKANSLDLSQYSAESVAVFKAALAEANLVLADESLSEDDQEIVDAAVQKLDAAIENLSAPEDGDTSKPEGGDEGTPSNPDKGNPDKGEEGTQTPTTGDHSDTAILFTAVFAVMMLAALVVIRRKKQNEM